MLVALVVRDDFVNSYRWLRLVTMHTDVLIKPCTTHYVDLHTEP